MLNKIIYSIIFCFFCSSIYAQKDKRDTQKRIDSLEQILSIQTDTVRAHTLYDLAYVYRYSEPQKAKKYIKEVIQKAQNHQNKLLSDSYTLLGTLLKNEGEYQKALENYLFALLLLKKENNKEEIASLNNSIGIIYKNTRDFERALPYYQDALIICEEIKLHRKAGMVLNNLGSVYMELGQHPKSKNYYYQAVEKAKIVQDSSVFAVSYANLGEWHTNQKNYDSAIYYIQLTLEIDEKQLNKWGICQSNAALGRAYTWKKEFSKAKPYFDIALKIAYEIDAKPIVNEIYFSLANFYEKQNQFEQAYHFQVKSQFLKDTILNQANQKEIARLREKYETTAKEQEIITLNQENLIKDLALSQSQNREKIQIGGFVFILILVGIVVFSIQKRNQYKQKIELAEKDNFYFAALVEAQEQERKRIAADLHDGLGQLLAVARMQVSSLEPLIDMNTNKDELEEDKEIYQENYEKSVQTLDLACKEIRSVSHQMMPYALIEQGLVSALQELIQNINELENNTMKIDFSTNLINQELINNRLHSSLEVSIFRIVQEVIGNSLKHAEATQFEINLNQKTSSEILLILKDNGKGFETSQITESKGLGWKNIYSRVAMAKGKIDILSENGIAINIIFPLIIA